MKHLGKENKKFTEPSVKILDKIENKQKENFLVRFSQPEFTSICPVTSQPDFAHIVIDYVPSKWIVESKSLKLYFQSFRNHQSFHEDVTMHIAKDITKLLKPKWFRIGSYIGIQGVVCLLMYFGNHRSLQKICGYLIKV